ncbi:hypothetical protein ON010_g18948 [Phytophthora cinnamomi]|nr:hypothetical protein ON010_g18948 [Phytophthora cinnamomi]
MPKIHNTFVEDGNLFPPFRLQVSPHRARTRAGQGAGRASLSRRRGELARFGIEALLASEEVAQNYSTDKQKLDVVVAYLRRVHHYIYYAGVQCLDMGDIMHAHPALFCRPPPSARDIEEEKARQEAAANTAKPEEDAPTEENKDDAANTEAGEKEGANVTTTGETAKAIGGWAAALDEKVQTYLKELAPEVVEAKRAKDRALVDEIETREEAALESTYSNYGEKASYGLREETHPQQASGAGGGQNCRSGRELHVGTVPRGRAAPDASSRDQQQRTGRCCPRRSSRL